MYESGRSMNFLAINPLFNTIPAQKKSETNVVSVPRFGLTMAQPLSKDTVSFKGGFPTKKIMSSRGDAITNKLAQEIRLAVMPSHIALGKKFEMYFGDILSKDGQKGLVTMLHRLKSTNSICEKTATRGWTNKKEVLANMNDISGYCFVLEEQKSFTEFAKRFSKMIKKGEVDVVEVEYHRLAPKYKKGKVEKTYESLSLSGLQKIKEAIIDTKNPTTQFWREVDSMSGYSGCHITVRNHDGTKSEIQIMIRGMHDQKYVENLFYKIRNGKTVDSKYRFIEQFLQRLKRKPAEQMTEVDNTLQKAMTKYTQESYENVLLNPFSTEHKFLSPFDSQRLTAREKEMLSDFDFNKIYKLMEACENIAII